VLNLAVVDGGLGGFALSERELRAPYIKDYDSIEGSRPADWARCFDTANWTLHSAWIDGQRVGGIVVAFSTEGVDMLERRQDRRV
jgi:hypothetical protein